MQRQTGKHRHRKHAGEEEREKTGKGTFFFLTIMMQEKILCTKSHVLKKKPDGKERR